MVPHTVLAVVTGMATAAGLLTCPPLRRIVLRSLSWHLPSLVVGQWSIATRDSLGLTAAGLFRILT